MPDLIPAAAALAATIVVVLIHLRSIRRAARWFEGKAIANGSLVRCIEQEDGDMWSTIEYEAGGQRYQITGNYAHSRDDVGRTLPVAYDPSLPSEARLVTEERDSAAGGLIGLGIVYAAFYILAATIASFLRER